MQILAASLDGALPPLLPVIVDADIPVTVNATSFSFVVFPQANAPACL